MWTRLREIKLSAEAQNSIDEYQSEFARFNDIWEGLQWLLARNPEPIGSCYRYGTVNGTEYFYTGRHGDLIARVPDVWILYSHNEQELLVHDIYACKASSDEEER